MKLVTKKTIPMLLSIMLVCSSLASCADKQTEVPSSNPESVVSSSTPEPTIDLKGRKIIMQAYAPDQIPDASTKTGERWLAKKAELEEKYNFTLETLITQDTESSEELRTSVMAGKPTYEIAVIRGDNMYKLARDGVIESLGDLGFDFSTPQWEQFTATTATYNGKIYGMNVGKLQPRGVIFFNKRLFKAAGLPDPIDQTQKGEWTWDTFLAAAKKLTVDTNGDGVIDQYGVCGPSDAVVSNLISSNGAHIVEGTDAKAKVVLSDAKAMKALEFYNQITNKDKVLMPKNARSGEDWDWFCGEFKNAKAAMLIYSYWPARGFAEEMADDWAFTFAPKGPDAADYVSVSDFFTTQVMPKNIENAKEIAQIWQELNSVFADEGDGWKDLYYSQTKDPRCVDFTISSIYNGKNIYEPYGLFGASDELSLIGDGIWNNTSTVEALVQAQTPVMEGKIKAFFNPATPAK